MERTIDLKVTFNRDSTTVLTDDVEHSSESLYEEWIEYNQYCEDCEDEYCDCDGDRLFEIPLSMQKYDDLRSLTVDGWTFPRGISMRADTLNSLKLTILKLKGIIIDCTGLSADSVLNIPTLRILKLVKIDGLRQVDMTAVIGRLSKLTVLKLITFIIQDQQPLDLSNCTELETVYLYYYMRHIPVLSETNGKLQSLTIRRLEHPDSADDVGGRNSDQYMIKHTLIPHEQRIHTKDWSFLLNCPLNSITLGGIISSVEDELVLPEWLSKLKQRLGQQCDLDFVEYTEDL